MIPLIVDAHVHVVCADTDRYPFHPMAGMGSTWWQEPGRGAVEELEATLDDNAVARAVVVQASGPYSYDCRCAIDTVAEHPERFALVGTIDMTSPDPAADAAALRSAGATGVRVLGRGDPDPVWLGNGRGAELWAAAADADLVVVPLVRHPHLVALGELCAAVPSAVVALDHCSYLQDGGPEAERDLVRLAELPSVHVKISTHNLVDPDAGPRLARLVDAFGADRMCWGSDHPQYRALTYAEMLGVASAAAATLDDTARAAFFGGTSLRLWWR